MNAAMPSISSGSIWPSACLIDRHVGMSSP
jgi:hypothetical protein